MFRPLFAWSLLVDPAFCRCSRLPLEMPLQMCANRTTSVLHKSCTLQIWTSHWYQKILFYTSVMRKPSFCIDLGIPTWSTCDTKKKRCLVNGGKSQFGLSNLRFWVGTNQTISNSNANKKLLRNQQNIPKVFQKLNSIWIIIKLS